MKRISIAIGLFVFMGAPLADMVSPALAASCRDNKGKFVACPPPVMAPKQKCRDAKGKFIACGAAPVAVPG